MRQSPGLFDIPLFRLKHKPNFLESVFAEENQSQARGSTTALWSSVQVNMQAATQGHKCTRALREHTYELPLKTELNHL